MTDDDVTTPASFTLTRTLEAPRALVWRAWTDPALTARWWHPAGVEVEPGSVAIDLREGGQYAYTMTVDGRRWPTAGTYLEIREPELLRFTWRGPEDADEVSPLVSVALEERLAGLSDEEVEEEEKKIGAHSALGRIMTAGYSSLDVRLLLSLSASMYNLTDLSRSSSATSHVGPMRSVRGPSAATQKHHRPPVSSSTL